MLANFWLKSALNISFKFKELISIIDKLNKISLDIKAYFRLQNKELLKYLIILFARNRSYTRPTTATIRPSV